MNCKNGSTLNPDYESEHKFYGVFESPFIIFPDQKTVVGYSNRDRNHLMMENITIPSSVLFINKHNGHIRTILYDDNTESILVGDYSGEVTQYKRIKNKWKVAKLYRDLGIEWVRSSTRIGNLVIFGGGNYKIIIIDVEQMKVISKPFSTAMKFIYSLQVCRKGNKYYISITGEKPSYSNNTSDIYDITALVESYVNKSKVKSNIKQNLGLFNYDKDQYLNKKIENLKNKLKMEKEKTRKERNRRIRDTLKFQRIIKEKDKKIKHMTIIQKKNILLGSMDKNIIKYINMEIRNKPEILIKDLKKEDLSINNPKFMKFLSQKKREEHPDKVQQIEI